MSQERGLASRRGSTATELSLMTAVLVIAVVCAGYLFIPGFAEGVLGLGEDVKTMLSTGAAGGGRGRIRGIGRPRGGRCRAPRLRR